MASNTVKYELSKLKQRLKTFTEHTGFSYEVDETYFLSLANPSQVAKRLKRIRWSNAKQIQSYKGITVIAHGTYKNMKTEVPLSNKEASQLTRAIKGREKATGKILKANVQSKKAVKSVIKYYSKIQTKEQAKEYERARNERAINNLIEEMAYVNTDGYTMLSDIIRDKMSIDWLMKNYSHSKWAALTEKIGFNIFDSDTYEEIKSGGKATLLAIMEFLGLTENDVIQYAFDTYDAPTAIRCLDELEIRILNTSYIRE